jgi:hypothetical protein
MFNFHPTDKQPVIAVWDCRARVGRWRVNPDRSFYVEDSLNWATLENAAIAEIEAQGGAVNMSGNNPCPDELYVLALFADGTTQIAGVNFANSDLQHMADAAQVDIQAVIDFIGADWPEGQKHRDWLAAAPLEAIEGWVIAGLK